ncbi:hypothetical protein ID866_1067 [Astraeus odoratus]|nr:hypothetical protein ID866_1067 [Astraeus odoratus]
MCFKYVNSAPIIKSFVRHYAATKPTSPLAFAFDIDGVLIRGQHALPAAKRALAILDGNNGFGVKIPYILLTNGGGLSETTRCRKLSDQLGVQINLKQYIQAHTVLRSIAHQYADKPVLVLGGKGETVRKVAESYGFRQVYNTLDLLAWNPSYMIGDNPESDIAGANAAGWKSILVHTGVYNPRQGPPKYKPTYETEDVEKAVLWALGQELRL